MYGIRLINADMCWPEFEWHVAGLLTDTGTRLYRYLNPQQQPGDGEE